MRLHCLWLMFAVAISFGPALLTHASDSVATAVPASKRLIVIEDPDLNPNAPLNKQGRKLILEAIYLEVGTDGLQSNKLYNAVTRARAIGLIAKMPFDARKDAITLEDVAELKAGMTQPGLKKYLDDPTVRLVVLGFADSPDDTEANTALAKKRATYIHDLLRKQCGVVNATHPLAVRDWLLSDPSIRTREYAAEVWLIVP